MAAKKNIDYENILYKMRAGYFASRSCIYPLEAASINHALTCGLITERKTLLMLRSFDFHVDIPPY